MCELDVFEAIHLRRTTREFTHDRVPDRDVEKILECARWAPSPENTQNWRFILVRDQKMKDAVARVATEASSVVFGGAPYSVTSGRLWYLPPSRRPVIVERMVQRRPGESIFGYNKDADVMVVACFSLTHGDSPRGVWSDMGIAYYPLAMACQNMWLAATALGYGMGFNFFPVASGANVEWLKDVLGIPPGWMPRATLGIGLPSRRRVLGPSRYPLEGIIYEERWGRPYRRVAFRR